jgi:PQQ-like domain
MKESIFATFVQNKLGEEKMQTIKNKTLAIIIATILVTSMAITLVDLPSANAHTPSWQLTTYAYIYAAPNPVGLGQQTLIFVWLDTTMQGNAENKDVRFHNYQLTITKPDGTNETKTFDVVTDPTSSAYTPYTPTQVGTYTLTFNFPGQVYTYTQANTPGLSAGSAAYQNDTYTPSTAKMNLVVQQDPVAKVAENPLPIEYWTRPVEGENHAWETVASNWLGGAAVSDIWQKNGDSPKSSHIMWTKALEYGGLTGDVISQINAVNTDPNAPYNQGYSNDSATTYYSGFSYNTRFGSPLIVNGILYYQAPLGEAGTGGGEFAVDLRTGQQVWSSTTFIPSKAQMYDLQTPNQHGVVSAILWMVSGTTWIGYNAFNQQPIINLTNVPSGTEIYTNDGAICRYQFSYNTATQTGWLALWNDTKAISDAYPLYAGPGWPNTGSAVSINANASYSWNVTINADLRGSANPSMVGIIPGDVILGSSSSVGLTSVPNPNANPWTMWAISDKPATRGNLTWIKQYAAPAGNITRMLAWQPIDPVNREWTMTDFETGQRLAYSLTDGSLLWGPLGDQPGFQYYSSREGLPAYGNLYVTGYGGVVYCYSMKDGTLLWSYGKGGVGNSTNSGDETPWGNYPTHAAAFADGMIYVMSGEHSPNTPLYKGYRARALDAFTGQESWTLLDWSASGLGTSVAPVAIADGYMAFANAYDGQVYVVGKGPSTMTVEAPMADIAQGSGLVIRGTVTDISAGTKQSGVAERFANGVPAVSDQSMSDWMAYVYQQKPIPANTTGVLVSISVVDSNGNSRPIGTATTDSSGTYNLQWTPDITGKFTVTASFAGSASYYPSHAVTAFAVDAAPTASPAPTTVAPSTVETYFVPAVIAIIVAIAIVGVLLAMLLLRKRP